MGYRIINGKLQFAGDITTYLSNSKNNVSNKDVVKANGNESKFSKLMKEKLSDNSDFTISKHALERLRERNINFNENDMKNISEGINKAKNKDCKECVMLYKNTALITSVKNRTIITAMNTREAKGTVFTNIDSVVMI